VIPAGLQRLSGGGMIYRGEYASGSTYNSQEVVRVSPDNPDSTVTIGDDSGITPGVYICITDGTGSDNAPRNPMQDGGENTNWNYLDTWPSLASNCVDGVVTPVIVDMQDKLDSP
jgi:hypothetical protein